MLSVLAGTQLESMASHEFQKSSDAMAKTTAHNIALRIKKKSNITLARLVLRPVGGILTRVLYSVPPEADDLWIRIDNIYGWSGAGVGVRFPSYPGQVKGGDWDLRVQEFSEKLKESHKFKAVQQRYINGIPWRETSIEHHFRRIVKKHGSLGGHVDFKEYAEIDQVRRDKLWQQVKRGLKHAGGDDPLVEPIYVHLDRFGRFLYTSNGNHRLFMAIALGYEKLPVRVWLRHKNWQWKREEFFRENRNRLFSPDEIEALHPDLRSLVRKG